MFTRLTFTRKSSFSNGSGDAGRLLDYTGSSFSVECYKIF